MVWRLYKIVKLDTMEYIFTILLYAVIGISALLYKKQNTFQANIAMVIFATFMMYKRRPSSKNQFMSTRTDRSKSGIPHFFLPVHILIIC